MSLSLIRILTCSDTMSTNGSIFFNAVLVIAAAAFVCTTVLVFSIKSVVADKAATAAVLVFILNSIARCITD